MKLTLDRFKTHTSKTLELPDTGLILLDGQSGAGKSTILKAFLYAAYGAVAKPVSWNETSCSVSWELKGQTITRGKGKGNISFNGLTGDSAQASLCSFLGMSEQEFIASSYIAQKNDNSLLTLTPAEQLRFIERLAFGEQSPDLFKKKIQETANSLSQSISSLESKIAGLHELTEQYSSQPTTDFSSYITAKEELSGLKDSLKQLKASKISLQEEALALTKEHSARIKLISEMQHIKQKAQDLKDLEANFANRAGTEQIESPENIQQQVKFLELALNLVKDNNLLSGLDAKRQEANLELLCTRETAKELFSKYLQAQHELLGSDRTTEELEALVSLREVVIKLQPFYSGKPVVLSEIKQFQEMLRAKVQGVEEQLANFYTARADAEIAEKLEGASCPECNTSLTIYNGALCVADSAGHQHSAEDCTHRIQETQTKLAKGKKIEAAVDHLISGMDFQLLSQFEDIASIEFAIETLSRRCNEYKELNTQIIAHGMETKALNEKCSKKESEVQTLDKEIELALARINKNPLGPEVLSYAKLPQDEIVSQLATHKVRYQNAQNMATELEKERAFLENLTTQKTELSTKYKTLKGQLGDWDREACEAAMQNAEAEVQSVILRIMNHESQIENLTETVNEGAILQAKQEEIAVHLKRTRDQIAQHSANAQPIIQKHAAALKLKELSDAAQMKSIAFTLDALNLGAKEYLDLMFQDPPISVELKPFKENKDSSVRAKLSLSVSYRGMELDNITDDVSGGENDRIILAYQLAMNSMYNSPILLLDEPFTGLNQELIDVCLDSLKVLSQNKLILVVAHGINKGMFDDVIEV